MWYGQCTDLRHRAGHGGTTVYVYCVRDREHTTGPAMRRQSSGHPSETGARRYVSNFATTLWSIRKRLPGRRLMVNRKRR